MKSKDILDKNKQKNPNQNKPKKAPQNLKEFTTNSYSLIDYIYSRRRKMSAEEHLRFKNE